MQNSKLQLKFQNYLLIFILILAAVLRLWGLAQNPPHLTNDEAALGYNAYSILKTGRDEHGQFLPVVFKSFGDWKPGLYVYLTVPAVATLGLNELAVRLPAAIAGIAAVGLIYLLVSELFKGRRLALLAALLLAVSPWHIQFSRGAWEAGVSLTLVLAGVYTFLRAVRDRPGLLPLSAALFASTLWAYQGAKLSSAIVIGLLVFFYRKNLFKLSKKFLTRSVIIGLLIALPVIISFFQGKSGRLEVYSVFSYERREEDVQEILSQGEETRNSSSYYLYHTEGLNFVRGILGRWLNHYSGRFLFFEGDWSNSRHGVPNAGVILVLDAVFLVAGLVALSRMGAKKEALFIWMWLLLAPLPAALSRDSIHAIRSFNMVIPLTAILAFGANFLWEKRKALGRLVAPTIVLFVLAYLANYIYYLDQYWVHAPKKSAQFWQYGYKQMVQKVSGLQGDYEEIVVKQSFEQPYIFFLFFQKHDPAQYQAIADEVFIPSKFEDVGFVSRLDNITFRDINWQDDRGMSGKLFIVDPIKVPIEDSSDSREFKIIDEIKYLDGQTAFRLIEIR